MIGGDLITYRPDIQVLDATIRDGGLVNDFYFTDEFIRALYEANIKAGVDYMEFGYKASKEMFDVNKFGKWKFCNEEDIRAIVGENNTDLKISVMADVGRCDYKKDIIDRADSVIDLVRVATYINTMPAAIEMIEDAHAKGYETTCNIMAVSKDQESDIDLALEMLGKSNVDGIYIVDSYGSLYPEQIKKLAEKYVAVGEKYGKKIGIHAHDNLKLAYANTVEAMRSGASMLDGTVSCMGRGDHILKFIEQYMVPLKAKGDAVWGYDVPYMLTGMLNQHPREAIDFIKNERHDYADMYSYLMYRE